MWNVNSFNLCCRRQPQPQRTEEKGRKNKTLNVWVREIKCVIENERGMTATMPASATKTAHRFKIHLNFTSKQKSNLKKISGPTLIFISHNFYVVSEKQQQLGKNRDGTFFCSDSASRKILRISVEWWTECKLKGFKPCFSLFLQMFH